MEQKIWIRRLPFSSSKNGQTATHQLHPHRDNEEPYNFFYDERPVIPLVFVPGVMASNLKKKDNVDVVWAPDELGLMAATYIFTMLPLPIPNPPGAEERLVLLDVNNTVVAGTKSISEKVTSEYWEKVRVSDSAEATSYYSNPRHHLESKKELITRGWDTVMGSVYHEFLHYAQSNLSHIYKQREDRTLSGGWPDVPPDGLPKVLSDEWQKVLEIYNSGRDLSTGSTFAEMVELADKYRFEFWVCGYNWLQSNGFSSDEVTPENYSDDASAERLYRFIQDKVFEQYRQNAGISLACEKVILVTHSMGGLVARAFCQRHADMVMGVLSAAMPCNGTAEIYNLFRQDAPFSIQAVVTGATRRENSIALFANSYGPIQLLPFSPAGSGGYMDSSPSEARAARQDKAVRNLILPDVKQNWLHYRYGSAEIFSLDMARSDIYAGVYQNREDYYSLLPDAELHLTVPGRQAEFKVDDLRKNFNDIVDGVKKLHDLIRGNYHEFTCGLWTASEDRPCYGEILWDNQNIRTIMHKGDDTVSQASWQGDLRRFRGYQIFDKEGFTHQEAYKDKLSQPYALLFLLYILQHGKEKGYLLK
jgi:pimeloyl-ACP methyl ester carboxylesterase